MTFTAPTARGRQNWKTIGRRKQMHAARWLAQRLNASSEFEQLGEGVVRVGYGKRERTSVAAGASSRFASAPVLVIIVRKKWPRGALGDPTKRVPTHVQTTVPIEGRRLTLAIPTDVCEAVRVRPQSIANACRVESSHDEVDLHGSVSALVRNRGTPEGPHYLLGCHHVLFRSQVTWNAIADPDSVVVGSGLHGDILGVPTRPAPFGPDHVSVDAALVRLSSEGRVTASQADFWRETVRDHIDDVNDLEFFSAANWRLISRFAPTDLNFVRTTFNMTIEYGSNDVPMILAEVIESRALGRWPRGGDSGGAIVAGQTLVGMHIAGSGAISYSVPAYQIFSSSVFSPRLELASDLIP